MVVLKEVHTSEIGGELRHRGQLMGSRTDFYPKLVGIQRTLNANCSAVFRTTTAGFKSKRKLTLELENFGPTSQAELQAITALLEDHLLDHLENSILPLIWSEGKELSKQQQDQFFKSIVVDAPMAGIALPIRLGTTGNGYVVFLGKNLQLDSEVVLEQHVKCCQIMVELVAIEERRMAPSEALSEREIACLQLAGDGRISEEIAVNLGLSVHTVNAYLGSATIKLDSVNRIQAIAKAIKLGYIH